MTSFYMTSRYMRRYCDLQATWQAAPYLADLATEVKDAATEKAKVTTLLQLWRDEGFNMQLLNTAADPKNPEWEWRTYRMYSPVFYRDAGRHAILRVCIVKATDELIDHNIYNISEGAGENPYEFPVVGTIMQ